MAALSPRCKPRGPHRALSKVHDRRMMQTSPFTMPIRSIRLLAAALLVVLAAFVSLAASAQDQRANHIAARLVPERAAMPTGM